MSQTSPPSAPPETGKEIEIQNESNIPSQDLKSTTPKKTPPLPWTHLETLNLIQVYEQKWYSLNRGQLKASQWEEVSISVAAHCGFDEPSKTGTQCRHKMEKLRKRYRSERQRSTISAWTYFSLMDQMERGPLPPISALPIASIDPRNRIPESTDEEEDDDDDEDDVNVPNVTNKSRSINHILRRPPIVSRFIENSASLLPRTFNSTDNSRVYTSDRKRRRSFVEKEEDEGEEEEGKGGELMMELAKVVRNFGEGFMKIEKRKMEIMKERERYKMEMEAKRTKMILDSQHRIVDAIAKAFSSQKKLNESSGDVNC